MWCKEAFPWREARCQIRVSLGSGNILEGFHVAKTLWLDAISMCGSCLQCRCGLHSTLAKLVSTSTLFNNFCVVFVCTIYEVLSHCIATPSIMA
jgi:hypothetical protein